MTKLDDLLAYEVVEGLTEGQFTAEEYVISILKRIEEVEPKVHSFITLDTEGALSSAKIIDKKIREKEDIGQLAGVTVGIKITFPHKVSEPLVLQKFWKTMFLHTMLP